ncbi:hypothetical protein GF318_03480 [Candidatus Micrarchaeota archaeon]|nr:hypothetical protein [Candidatus Micrarchaeota archaeon]
MARKTARERSSASATSYMDINQLELAFINRVLDNPREKREIPDFVEIGRSKRILQIQKRNLQSTLRGMDRERAKGRLESELRSVLSSKKRLPISCFLFR